MGAETEDKLKWSWFRKFTTSLNYYIYTVVTKAVLRSLTILYRKNEFFFSFSRHGYKKSI